MPKTIANFKCNICGDIFTATSEGYTSCKCGETEVQPREISTSYAKGSEFTRLADGNDHTYYNEEDLYVMKEDILDLYNEVKALCKELGFYVHEWHKHSETGDEFLKYINMSNFVIIKGVVSNELVLKVELYKDLDESKLKSRLLKFKDLLLKIKNKEVDVADRKQLLSDELDLEWEREQADLYNYTFYV